MCSNMFDYITVKFLQVGTVGKTGSRNVIFKNSCFRKDNRKVSGIRDISSKGVGFCC